MWGVTEKCRGESKKSVFLCALKELTFQSGHSSPLQRHFSDDYVFVFITFNMKMRISNIDGMTVQYKRKYDTKDLQQTFNRGREQDEICKTRDLEG